LLASQGPSKKEKERGLLVRKQSALLKFSREIMMTLFSFTGIVAGIAIGFVISFAVMWVICNRDKDDAKS
jgi:hypothetical protein